MSNLFLKVNKDLFGIGLNPIEILIVSQVLEFQTKKLECYITDESFAKDFNVSRSTIARAVKALEDKGVLNRQTTNIKGGKLRYLTINIDKIEELINKCQNDTCKNENEEINKCQFDYCTSVNLTIDKQQNDTIKDKRKDKNIKDNEVGVIPKGKVEVMSEVLKECSKNPNNFNF